MSGTVLAIDKNPAFLLALAVHLDQCGISLVPASTVRQARNLTSELKLKPDIVVVNCRVAGVCAFVLALSQVHLKLKVVTIVSQGSQCERCKALVPERVEAAQQYAPQKWSGLLRSMLR